MSTKEQAHTAGPWRVEDTNGAKLTCVVVPEQKGANGNWVVIGQIGGPDKEANARLIAAAPDMLAALIARREARDLAASISEAHADGTGPLPKHVMDKADLLFAKAERLEAAAIAKAEGRS